MILSLIYVRKWLMNVALYKVLPTFVAAISRVGCVHRYQVFSGRLGTVNENRVGRHRGQGHVYTAGQRCV